MDKSSIRKEITVLINSIKEHYDNVGDNENIPLPEMDLIFHKIEKLYQKYVVFNYLNLPQEKKGSFTISEKIISDPINKSIVVVPEVKISETINESTPAISIDLSIEESTSSKNSIEEKIEVKKVNKHEEKKEEKLATNKIQKPVIPDLTKGIGLNDKFLFANELFAANMQEYSIAIQQLNAAGNIESAMDYFNSLQQLYNWDVEREAVKRLLDLVDRRYS